jgi:Domain of unknown function (DUF4340)
MQPRQFNMLALAAVISLIAAGVVHSSYNSFNEETVSGKRLFPSLESQAGSTARIAIQQGENKLTLKKSADGKIWSMEERAGYPVKALKVRELVVKLSQAELIEKKTSSKALHGELDLGDPTVKDATAKQIRLADANGKAVAEVIIGKERRAAFGAGQSGTYVRKLSDPQTWLAKMELNASTSVMDWVEPIFFKVDDQKIKTLVMKAGGKVIFTVARGKKKKNEKVAGFELTDVPKGKTKQTKLRVDDLVNGIRTLEMTDVRKAQAADSKPDMTAEITMDDGAKYQVGLKREDKKRWVSVTVLENGKDAAKAKKISAATKGWAYEIADWRAGQTFKKDKEVFETVAVEKPKAETPKMSTPPSVKPLAPGVPPGTAPKQPATVDKKMPEPANAGAPKK